MNKLIFLFFPLILSFFLTAGYAETNDNEKAENIESYDSCCKPAPCPPLPCKECEICPPCEPCSCCNEVPSTGEPCKCAYNAPARIDPACGWKTWVEGSFIYWQAKETGLEPCYQQIFDQEVLTSSGNSIFRYDMFDQNFDFHPGFKLGAGISCKRDDWTFYLEYTWLKAKDSTTIDITDTFDSTYNQLITTWTTNLTNTDHNKYVHSTWTLNFNLLDLEIGRPYYLGRKLIFSPYFGLRSGWIDQKYDVFDIYFLNTSAPNINAFINAKEDTWLLGPRVGVDSNWLIGCDFRIIAGIAGSLTYQNFKTNISKQEPIQPDVKNFSSRYYKRNVNRITPNAEASLGLGYGRYFCRDMWHFDLSVKYEINYFWDQNEMRHLSDIKAYINDGQIGNLMVHGLTLTCRIDF